jgi:hypothetical protein
MHGLEVYRAEPSGVEESFVQVRLIRKLAECIDGVNLEGFTVGDVLDLPPRSARILIAEQWAVPHVVTPPSGTGSSEPGIPKKQSMTIAPPRRHGRSALPRDP